MDPFLRERLPLIAAFGAGIALSASFAGIYSKFKSRNSRSHDESKLDCLVETIEQLKRVVEEIKVASLRGSPYSSRPVEKWDIDRLEEIAENSIDMNMDEKDCNNPFEGSNGTDELINPDTSDNDEFYDFTDGFTDFQASSYTHQNAAPSFSKSTSNKISLEDWLRETDVFLKDSKTDKEKLYSRICQGIDRFGENASLLWRKAKAAHLLSVVADKKGEKTRKKDLIFESLECAQKAVELDANSADCHKWYAIALGSITDYVGTKERIESGYKFKEHVDRALKLSPNDETLHYLIGRWSSEVSNLTWLEKRLAATLYSNVPEATANEALASLLRAYELRPEWKQNIYYISKTLLNMKRKDEAFIWLEKGLVLPVDDEDDQMTHDKLLLLKAKNFKS